MDQRRTGEWRRPSLRRPRALIEDQQAVWFSDFERFRAAGFEVAVCTGPDAREPVCPHLDGRRCELWEEADVVLCVLPLDDPACRLAFSCGRRDHPVTPVVLGRAEDGPATDTELTKGTLALRFPTSIDGQIHALRKALWGAGERARPRGYDEAAGQL